jgi:hypothetical protein
MNRLRDWWCEASIRKWKWFGIREKANILTGCRAFAKREDGKKAWYIDSED